MYGKFSVPWWNGLCRVAVKKKKCAFRRYLRSPTQENYNFYKKTNSEAKRIVRQSKKTSWINFLAAINTKSTVKEIWFQKRFSQKQK